MGGLTLVLNLIRRSLRAAGLHPLTRTVEATWEDDQDRAGSGCTFRCFLYDRCLLTALVDRWRLKTHTFHLPHWEMAPTLQDVTFLTGFPYADFPLAVYDIPATWCTEFLTRFQGVLSLDNGYREFSSTHGATLKWICQFYISLHNYCPLASIHM